MDFIKDVHHHEYIPQPPSEEHIAMWIECWNSMVTKTRSKMSLWDKLTLWYYKKFRTPAEWVNIHPMPYQYTRPASNGCRLWISRALEHEKAFRAILDKFGRDQEWYSIHELFDMYAVGDRYGIWSILDFRYEDGLYIFEEEDIATLSGHGSTRSFRINEKGEAELVKTISVWMS